MEFEETAYRVDEDDGEVEVCLRISGMISSPAIVQLIATPDTAEGTYIHIHEGRLFKLNIFSWSGLCSWYSELRQFPTSWRLSRVYHI